MKNVKQIFWVLVIVVVGLYLINGGYISLPSFGGQSYPGSIPSYGGGESYQRSTGSYGGFGVPDCPTYPRAPRPRQPQEGAWYDYDSGQYLWPTYPRAPRPRQPQEGAWYDYDSGQYLWYGDR